MLARTPWSPPAPTTTRQWRLKKERRAHFIAATVNILRHGEPTVFVFEGACRHALRARFCMEGVSWHLADLAAADIIRAALHRIGATRPRWIEGQRDYAHLGALLMCEHCHNCGRPLLGAIDVKYCSPQCRAQFHTAVVSKWRRAGDAYNSAVRMTRGLDEQHNAA